MSQTHKYPQWKLDTISEVEESIKSNKTIALCNLHKVRATQLMKLRKNFKDELKIRVVKNTLSKIAVKNSSLKISTEILESISAQQAFIFTNMNPFQLYLLLEKGKVDLPARDGDIASGEIVVPSGNTGMQPGPDLSAFKAFNIPTRIDAGSIFVSEDTIVAKKGDVIKSSLAALLSKLDIKPIKAGVKLDVAFMENLVYNSDDLSINLDDYRDSLIISYRNALDLAVSEEYFTKETVPLILADAYNKSKNLSVESNYLTEDNASMLIAKKQLEAQTLNNLINLD
tara:strand:+ start:727 stop:1581 length:855 start_codon:yes stop_codon:yes gene_type:complete